MAKADEPSQTLLLQPSPLNRVLWSAACVAGLLMSVLMISAGDKSGWLVLTAGGALAYLSLPWGKFLRLQEDGFLVRQARRETFVRWNETDRFSVVTDRHGRQIIPRQSVVFNYDSARVATYRVSATHRGEMDRLPSNFGMDALSLAALMNEWRDRALSGE